MIIKNMSELVSHGNRRGRRLALEILEAALAAADPYRVIHSLVRIDDNHLHVGGRPSLDISGFGERVIDLKQVRNIYVVGAGKMVQRQALALEEILGDRLTGGAITVKKGEGAYLSKIEVTEGAHPVPDADSVRGAVKIVEIAQSAGSEDLVFTVFSDGASALFPLPAEGIKLDDVQAVYRLAIKYGWQNIIHHIMKYFSAVNHGRIMGMIHPAQTVNFVMQVGSFESQHWHGKVPTDGWWIHSWPPPQRHFEQDVARMQAERWWDEIPPAMQDALVRLDPRYDVPPLDDFLDVPHCYWQSVDYRDVLEAAKKKAKALEIQGVVLGRLHMAQSTEMSKFMMSVARQIAEYGEPFEPPVALLTYGELVVPVGNADGIGGRNQEYVLAAATMIGDSVGKNIVVASVDSDGTDGPGTQYTGGPEGFVCQAGGVADGDTVTRARELGLDIESELRNHNSSMPLARLADAIVTGNTGTCIGDLRVVVVLGRNSRE